MLAILCVNWGQTHSLSPTTSSNSSCDSSDRTSIKMGGRSAKGEDPMEWPEANERMYLEILAERVTKDLNGAPIFKTLDWAEMDEQVFLKTGLRYGAGRLKGKFNRMRKVHAKFTELITDNTNVTWDPSSGVVSAKDSIWGQYIEKDKIFKAFKKHGCKLYHFLCVVFGSPSMANALNIPSTTGSQNSDEERIREEENLTEGSQGQEKRASEGDEDVDFHPVKRKVRRNDTEPDAVLVIPESLKTRKEKEKGLAERYKAQSSDATSSMIEEFSIRECMVALNAIPNVSTKAYNEAVKHFLNLDWRTIFLLMNDGRKKGWLKSLE